MLDRNKPLWVLGLMSGTSMDGVDAAMIKTDGQSIFEWGETAFFPYSTDEQHILRQAMGKWQDEDIFEASKIVHSKHEHAVAAFSNAELIGFHGQTLAHDPKHTRTHQIGEGQKLGASVPVVYDFRAKDVAMGGEGAPLIPIFHWAMAKHNKISSPIAIVNIGGVGNITYIDPNADAPENGLIAFDTGPGNALMDDYLLEATGQPYDVNGQIALQGMPNSDIVTRALNLPFLSQAVPKSLDRNAFDELIKEVAGLELNDAMATLAQVTVDMIVNAKQHCPMAPTEWWIAGGGRKNMFIMNGLKDKLNVLVYDADEKRFDGDMIEAQGFAFLAARVAYDLPNSFPMTTGVDNPIVGGKIYKP